MCEPLLCRFLIQTRKKLNLVTWIVNIYPLVPYDNFFEGNEILKSSTTVRTELTSFLFLTVCIQTTLLKGSKLNHGSLDIHRGACWRKSNYIRYNLNLMMQVVDVLLVFHEFMLWNDLQCTSSQTVPIILTFLKKAVKTLLFCILKRFQNWFLKMLLVVDCHKW